MDIVINNAGEVIAAECMLNLSEQRGLTTDASYAGIVRDSSFARMSKEQWDAVHQVHLEGTMRCVMQVAKMLSQFHTVRRR